jgi:hypothetical protein
MFLNFSNDLEWKKINDFKTNMFLNFSNDLEWKNNKKSCRSERDLKLVVETFLI